MSGAVLRRCCRFVALFVVARHVGIGAVGADADAPQAGSDKLQAPLLERFGTLSHFADGLDWEAEQELVSRAIDSVWERNGWNDEANQFARSLARDVLAIPPWEVTARLDLIFDRVSQRYQFSEGQNREFRRSALREASGLLMGHARLLFSQVAEVLRTRAANQPFTAEQAARWSQESEDFFRDARQSTDRLVGELAPTLREDQRRILDRDLAAFNKRWDMVAEMRKRWAEGKWAPEEWGLANDPIQQRRAVLPERLGLDPKAPGASRASAPTGSPRNARWFAHEPSTWMAYVSFFQRRFDLDLGQANSARSIHDELVARANAYMFPRAAQLQAVPVSERATHDLYQPICGYFGELETRLDDLLTAGQRARGGNEPSDRVNNQ